MTDWSGCPVLVTGATGLLGAALVRRLAGLGAEVRGWAVDDRPWSRLDLEPPAEPVRLEMHDLAGDTWSLEEAAPRVVFHLGARTLVEESLADPPTTFQVNTLGTYRLLESMRHLEPPPRCVFASSDKAYGRSDRLPYHEDDPLVPVDPYGASKACADVLARCFAETYGLPVVVTRSANLYGPGDCHRSRLVPGVLADLHHGRAPRIRSDGRFRRDFLFVEDAVDALLLLGDPDRSGDAGRVYNLGGGEGVEVRRVVELLAERFPDAPPPEIENRAVSEIRDQWLDASRAHEELGWQPRTSLEDGLAATVDWYRAHPATLE